nr:hypothetical protein [Providencia rettgeri]
MSKNNTPEPIQCMAQCFPILCPRRGILGRAARDALHRPTHDDAPGNGVIVAEYGTLIPP